MPRKTNLRPRLDKEALQLRVQTDLLVLSMRRLLIALLFAGLVSTARADIQDPPGNDYGPTRKLGRGLSNMFFGWAEIPVTIGRINADEGNAAAAGYGVIKGTGRAFARFGAGFYEAARGDWTFFAIEHGGMSGAGGYRALGLHRRSRRFASGLLRWGGLSCSRQSAKDNQCEQGNRAEQFPAHGRESNPPAPVNLRINSVSFGS